MRLTKVNLKSNRAEIIATLTKEIGTENLKSAMNMLVQQAEFEEMFEENKTIEEEIKEITSGDYFQNRKMKTADYIAELNDHKIFNHSTKNWE